MAAWRLAVPHLRCNAPRQGSLLADGADGICRRSCWRCALRMEPSQLCRIVVEPGISVVGLLMVVTAPGKGSGTGPNGSSILPSAPRWWALVGAVLEGGSHQQHVGPRCDGLVAARIGIRLIGSVVPDLRVSCREPPR